MSTKTKVVLGIVTVIVLAAVIEGWLMVRHGFSARDEPSAVEAVLARVARRMAMPSDAREAKNPVQQAPEVMAEAMAHFADHCSFCHANDGSGDTPIGKGLYPKPPDLRQPGTQSFTDGELFYIIHNGVRLTGMPAFGDEAGGPDLDSWKLVHFIRHLPNMTIEELERMKDLNPKTPDELQEEEEARKFLQGDSEAVDDNSKDKGHKHH